MGKVIGSSSGGSLPSQKVEVNSENGEEGRIDGILHDLETERKVEGTGLSGLVGS